MDMHRTFKKETVLGDQDEKEDQEDEEIIRAGDPSAQSPGSNQGQKQKKKGDSFIWTFLIQPVHEDERKS